MFVVPSGLPGVAMRAGNLDLSFQPPTRLAPPTWRPIPQLNDDNVQRIVPGATSGALLRMVALPTLDEEGHPTLLLITGDESPPANLPADTISIFVAGEGHETEGAAVSGDKLEQLLVWLRVLSRQWWIGRPTEAVTGNLHLIVPIGVGGVPHLPYSTGKQTTPDVGTKFVSPEMWSEAIDYVEKGQEPPAADRILANSRYHYFSEDFELAIILVCTAFEGERDRILDKARLKKSELKTAGADIVGQVSNGFSRVFGRSLLKEEPDNFAFLKTCWTARGSVAHGKPLVWIKNGEHHSFSEYPSTEFFDRAEAVIAWLRTLP